METVTAGPGSADFADWARPSWSIDGDVLTLTAGSETFTFDRAKSSSTDSPAPSSSSVTSPLVGRKWDLVEITVVRSGLMRSRSATSGLTMTLHDGGSITDEGLYFPTCVTIRSSWRSERQRIFVTQKYGDYICSGSPIFTVAQREALAETDTFEATLHGTVSRSISNAQLRLTKGDTTLIFDAS